MKENASPRDRAGLALHSLRAVAGDDVAQISTALRKTDPALRIHIHASETVHEVEECMAGLGARPVQWLLDNVGLNDAWTIIHATHLDTREWRELAESGAVAGLCPMTEATVGDGFFPLVEYQSAQGRWGIGTDSHYVANPAMELRMLECGKRLQLSKRNLLADPTSRLTAHSGRRLFDLALAGGAQAVGQNQGAFTPGTRADIVMLDKSSSALLTHDVETVFDAWILGGSDNPVRDVLIAGEWVVRDGHHPLEEQIAQSYAGEMRKLFVD